MHRDRNRSSPQLDRAAVALSALCLVHCLALPLLVVGLPLATQFTASHWHVPMLAVVLPVSVAAILIGYRSHGNRALLAWAVTGLALLVIGGTLAHAWFGAAADRGLTVTGSLVLAFAHWQNSRLMRGLPCRLSTA